MNGATEIQMIPINEINVLNPRSRNKAVFQGIVSNISNVGLKRPITVTRRSQGDGGKPYDLVCGQGRLEAYVALGQTTIPAVVIETSREECFLMSLVENIARRQASSAELLREISTLRQRGYNLAEISKKIDLAKSSVTGIAHLLEHGEERLLAAVERGRIPLSVAVQISNSDEEGIQQALCEAYEDKSLRGSKLLTVRRVIEERTSQGKRFHQGVSKRVDRLKSSDALVRAYKQEADRQQLLMKKARLTETRLLFVISALKKLLEDENFVTLLRAEGLDTLPANLVDRIKLQRG